MSALSRMASNEHKAVQIKKGDVVILSSANRQAVQEEWERQGFLPYTDLVLAQDAGTKAECVRLLLQLGYDPDRVLVIGEGQLRGDFINQGLTQEQVLAAALSQNNNSDRKTA